jgi:formylglycine-generating enzyme required for sulfatase activity
MSRWWAALSLTDRQVRGLGTAMIGLGIAVLPGAGLWAAAQAWWTPVVVRPEMVELPGGTFVMGSPEGEEGREDDEVQHSVRLSPFLISKTEVTQGMWRAVMGSLPACDGDKRWDGDEFPMLCVSWYDAEAFCSALSELEGLPEGQGYRLPTEAEWEFAARAGSTTAWAGTTDPEELCGFAAVGVCEGVDGPQRVGTRLGNAWGLHDMSGNVWEWTADWYGPYQGDATDPRGPPSGSARVNRGGSWWIGPANARVANRDGAVPSDRAGGLGFRLARSLPSALSPSDPPPASEAR